MKRARRIVLWTLGAAAALAVLALAAALAIARSDWFRQQVRQRIVRELETATGGSVELAGFRFDRGALEARADGLVIRGKEGPDQPPLLRAASIRVGLKIASVIRRAVDVRSLTVTRPQIHLIVYPDGSTNLPAPKAPRPRRKGVVEQLLDLAVDRFRLEDGLLLFGEQRLRLEARGEDLRAALNYEFDGPRYRGMVSFARLETGLGGLKGLPLALEAGLALDGARLEISSLRMSYQGSNLEARGAIENWAEPRAAFDYKARLRLGELIPALGIRWAPGRGEADLEGRAEVGRGGYALEGRLRARGLAFEHRAIRVEGAAASARYLAAPGRIELRELALWAAGGRLGGRAELAAGGGFKLEGVLKDLALEQLVRAARRPELPFAARISGPLSLSGRLAGGALRDVEAEARLTVAPAEGGVPLSGWVQAGYSMRTGAFTLGRGHLATPRSRIEFAGVPGRRLELALETAEADDIERARALLEGAPSKPLELRLPGGRLAFRGVVLGDPAQAEIEGHLTAHSFELEGRRFESLEAEIQASPARLRARSVRLAAEGVVLTGAGRLGLEGWKPAANSALDGLFQIEAAEVSRPAQGLGWQLPVSGQLSATVKVSGTWAAPLLQGQAQLKRALLAGQPVEALRAAWRYGGERLEIASLEAQVGTGRAAFSGEYVHRKEDLREGRLRFRLSSDRVRLSELRAAAQAAPGLDAVTASALSGELDLTPGAWRLRALDGTVSLRRLTLDRQPWGGLELKAASAAAELSLTLRGKLAGAALEGESRWKLEGEYPGSGTVSFTRMQFSTLLARLGVARAAASGTARPAAAAPELPFEGFMEGKLRFQGAALAPASWSATLELPAVELRPAAARLNGTALGLSNQGPLLVDLSAKEARIRQARFIGKQAAVTVSGNFLFGSRYPFNLRLQGGFDLALLAELDANLRARGAVTLDAALRGLLARPDLYGRVEFRNASLSYGDLPNGLDKLNGVVFLYRDRAMIERLTAESGGGKVGLEGFVTFSDPAGYSLQLKASEVRVRYPEGVSSTVNAALALTGAGERSVLSGEVTVTRAAFHPQTDLGSMLARSAQTAPAPPPAPWLEGMRLDVRLRTAPQVRLETSLTRSIQAEADLRLRGSAVRPALLGRTLISQGEILFFGNRYAIESGEILFVNPSRIEPVVNLHLQTRVRGVEVTLNINGPLNKTAVTYRSDPPLPFSDIVALLATGRAPSTSPGLTAARSEFAQSWEQAGAGALVSQAITSPLAGRLQRFLGVSRLKIDPSVRGIENTPEAHLTLEQQIGQDVTLVYVTNLTRAQQQTIRLEWDFTRNWSALAVREANGLFGVDFLYKKRFK